MAIRQSRAFAVCVDNEGYEASLEKRKIYQVIVEEGELAQSGEHNLLRVIDESGEDYLYPARMFVELQLPPEAEEAFSPAAG